MTKAKKILRCIHRHTISEHPNCFAKGLVNKNFKDARHFERETGIPWYNMPGTKIGYFDIETTADFNADWGTVLSWCIKDKGGKIFSSVINRDELLNKTYDKNSRIY